MITRIVLVALMALSVFIKPALAKSESEQHNQAHTRIIALSPHIVEMLFEIGAGANIVGVSSHSDYPKEALTLPIVANYASVNFEAVLALKPDVVIAWKNGNPETLLARLRQFGIKVEYSNPVMLEDIPNELRFLGQLSGKVTQANNVAAQFEQKLQDIKNTYKDKTPVTVFFATSTAPLATVANNAWAQQMLNICQADNPFKKSIGDYPQVGLEQVIQAMPYVIVKSTERSWVNKQDIHQVIPADFSFFNAFEVIPAVKHKRFVSVNADWFYRATSRSLQGLEELCQGIDNFR